MRTDPSFPSGNRLFSVPEAARYLAVGKRIVYPLIEFGELRAVRLAGSTRIEKASLDAYRASGKRI